MNVVTVSAIIRHLPRVKNNFRFKCGSNITKHVYNLMFRGVQLGEGGARRQFALYSLRAPLFAPGPSFRSGPLYSLRLRAPHSGGLKMKIRGIQNKKFKTTGYKYEKITKSWSPNGPLNTILHRDHIFLSTALVMFLPKPFSRGPPCLSYCQ